MDTRKQVEEMVEQVDEDLNIEFNEFLKLVKGGNKNKSTPASTAAAAGKAAAAGGGSGDDLIFNFFKKLTDGELQPNKNMKIGFGVFYSAERRRKLLNSILNKDGLQKKEGDRIVSNYAMSLQDQMKRVRQA